MANPLVRSQKIAIFSRFHSDGGVERMMANLAEGFLAEGFEVDLILMGGYKGTILSSLPSGIRIIDLKQKHSFSCLPRLISYLRREKPDALLAAKESANLVALTAKILTSTHTRIAISIRKLISQRMQGQGLLKNMTRRVRLRILYSRADAILAISKAVADDTVKVTGIARSRISIVPNPVVTPALETAAEEPITHPWLVRYAHRPPLIVRASRLVPGKDVDVLIRAVAKVREQIECRLLVLGEGHQRQELESLIESLGLQDSVSMPGHIDNPYPYIRSAQALAANSRHEAFGNTVVEALALGVPVVATDCPGGPGEILQNGLYGKLVPVGDSVALASALVEVLQAPPEPGFLRQGAERYTLENSLKEYSRALL